MCLGITAIAGGSTGNSVVADAATADSYYSGITASGGRSLSGQLHDLIVKTHTNYTSYDDCKSSKVQKTDPGPNGGVLEFYTQESIYTFSGTLGTWNREHVWCQSNSGGLWGTGGGGADMHHIRPSEGGLNSTRGNNKYGELNGGGKPAYSRDSNKNNVALGGYVGNGTFEPLDNVKGDVARICMYVYLHYNNASNVGGTINASKTSGTLKFSYNVAGSEDAAIQMLLKWNKLDPVDDIERTRNEEVFKIQGNRNPFIDNSSYADAIWGNGAVTPPDPVDPPELSALAINPASVTMNVGQTRNLTVSATPSNASKSVIWTTSDSSVATVSNGAVTAKGEGTATITATSTEKPTIKATARITVKPELGEGDLVGTFNMYVDLTAAPDVGKVLYFNGGMAQSFYFGTTENVAEAAEVEISEVGDGYTLKTGDKYIAAIQSGTYVNVALQDSVGIWQFDKNLKTFIWHMDSTGKDYYLGTRTNNGKTYTTISVSDIKYITGENEPNVGVTQFIVGFEIAGDVPTPPAELESLTINKPELSLKVGQSDNLTVTAVPEGASNEVLWVSINPDIAFVSANGKVTAVNPGEVVIAAVSLVDDSIFAFSQVTVTESEAPVEPPVRLESIAINPSELSLKQGGSVKLGVTFTPNNVSDKSVTWYSGDTSIVEVANDGTITAVGEGTVVVIAISNENTSIGAEVTITVKPSEEAKPDAAKVAAFKSAVSGLINDGTLGERLAKINTAINAYRALSEVDKTAVVNEIEILNAAIENYNKAVNEYNSAMTDAESSAMDGAGAFLKR